MHSFKALSTRCKKYSHPEIIKTKSKQLNHSADVRPATAWPDWRKDPVWHVRSPGERANR